MSLAALARVVGPAAQRHAPLGARTTYRVGGTGALLVEVAEPRALTALAGPLSALDCPVLVLGLGSNLLVSDDEFPGVVVVLGPGFAGLDVAGDGDVVTVAVGGAVPLPVAARQLAAGGVTGFEWAVGIPGSAGGAAVMNAGGHGGDMAQVVAWVDVVDLTGGPPRRLGPADLHYGYRRSALGATDLVTAVGLSLRAGDPAVARDAVRAVVAWRRAHQPGGANAGSVFQNPPGASAGELIEAAGLKGRTVGGARVSAKHANFFLVDETATARDVVALMLIVRDAVRAHCGVTLTSELRLVGFDGLWP